MKRRKDGRWVKKIKLPNGSFKFFYSTAETEKKATIDIDKQILTYNTSTEVKEKSLHNFKSVADEMLESQSVNISFATQQNYRYSIAHLQPLYNYAVEEITPMMVQNLLNELGRKKYSKSAMSKVKTTVGLILKHAALKGYHVTNFAQCLKVPKSTPKKVLSPDDVVIEAITKNATTTEFGLWALTLLCTGFRPGEVNALKKGDVDFEKRTIKNTHSVEFIENQPRLKESPKTEAGIRTVPLLDLLYDPLYAHCQQVNANEFIFGGKSPFSKTQLRKRWTAYCLEINHKFTQYQLRHAYALILYRAGVDVKTAQYFLGHTDFSTTMNIYTQFSKEKNLAAAENINSYVNNFFNKALTTF